MNTIKSKEEILKDQGIYPGFRSTYTYEGILAAMREYASQFQSSHQTPPQEIRAFLRKNRIVRAEMQESLFELIKSWETYKAALQNTEEREKDVTGTNNSNQADVVSVKHDAINFCQYVLNELNEIKDGKDGRAFYSLEDFYKNWNNRTK